LRVLAIIDIVVLDYESKNKNNKNKSIHNQSKSTNH
jgi:hypothetical protein